LRQTTSHDTASVITRPSSKDEIYVYAKEIRAPLELVRQTRTLGRLPTVNFAAGGVATPADAALMMQLGRAVQVDRRLNLVCPLCY